MFEDHWTEYYGKYSERNKTVFAKVSDFFAQHDEFIQRSGNESIPPWIITPPLTDDSLSSEVSKHESPEALLVLSNDLTENHKDHIRIGLYTDASKIADNRVGIGCYIEAKQYKSRAENHAESLTTCQYLLVK